MKEEEIKKQLAEILRANIHYSTQLENYVIHGAIEAIWKLMQEYAAQSAPKQNTAPAPENLAQDIYNALWAEGSAMVNESLHIIQQVLDRHEVNTLPKSAPVLSEEEIKKQIAEILRTDIHYFSQAETYVIHGALEAIWKLMQEYAAQLQSATPVPVSVDTKYQFEKYPLLEEYIREYASFGQFSSWSGFLFELNNILSKAQSAPKQSAGVNYKWVKASDELPTIEQVRLNHAVMIIKINGFNATTMYDYKTGRFWTSDPKKLDSGGTITFKNEEVEWLKQYTT